ncbi:MAG: diaminopimelate decarboxylase [Chloroflexota bacterium]
MTALASTRLSEIAPHLRRAGGRFGTPVSVTDMVELTSAAETITSAFPDPWLRSFSVKANDVSAIVGRVASLGFGANVVSRGEWAVARRAGLPDARVTFEGVGKSDADLRAAVDAAASGHPPRWLAVESLDEANALVRIAAARLGRGTLDLLFRLNPAVAPDTSAGLAVGAAGSKFGMTADELTAAIGATDSVAGLVPRGIHLHVGSQLQTVDAWRDATRRGLALGALIRGGRPGFDTLDLGGGFPVAPSDEPVPSPAHFAREVPGLLVGVAADRRPTRFAIEPGRYLVARAGLLVGRVLHIRDRGGRQVVIDVGMTEIIRPALYGARHDIVALTSLGRPALGPSQLNADGAPLHRITPDLTPALVEGPLCESTDHLGEHRLPPLRRGDLVAILDTGAYAASLASSYNGRPRPPQVILEPDGALTLVRRRGSLAGLG